MSLKSNEASSLYEALQKPSNSFTVFVPVNSAVVSKVMYYEFFASYDITVTSRRHVGIQKAKIIISSFFHFVCLSVAKKQSQTIQDYDCNVKVTHGCNLFSIGCLSEIYIFLYFYFRSLQFMF